jgi:hypothetical protein
MTPSEQARHARVLRGETVVASQRSDHALIAWAQAEGLAVKISRPGKWGNPFHIGPGVTRDQACDRFNDYLAGREDLLAALPYLRGKVLICWCHPLRCHGDRLAELANAS